MHIDAVASTSPLERSPSMLRARAALDGLNPGVLALGQYLAGNGNAWGIKLQAIKAHRKVNTSTISIAPTCTVTVAPGAALTFRYPRKCACVGLFHVGGKVNGAVSNTPS